MKFTNIPDKLNYTPAIRAKLSSLHSDVITHVMQNYTGLQSYRSKVISAMNSISYYIWSGEGLPADWSSEDPLNIPIVDDSLCRSMPMYIVLKIVVWDIDPVVQNTSPGISETISSTVKQPIVSKATSTVATTSYVVNPTPKEDLYLKPPVIARFDTHKVWKSGVIAGDRFTIYTSLPEVPTKQNQISVTTDISNMSTADLLELFPNRFIQTRAASMYQKVDGIEYHPDLGLILPVSGYSRAELIDNLVRYPHFFKLTKDVDGRVESFYSTIEIDGELHKTLDVWDSLPESAVIPKTAEFIKEYVVRRYLLERDIDKIDHRYTLHGTLDPFLTLFTTSDEYIKLGYSNPVDLAKQCVISRVNYKRSRNPVLRRLDNV